MTDNINKALADTLAYGRGFMLDGKHVPLEDVFLYPREAIVEAKEAGAAEERTKIVAWLRERDGFNDYYSELKDQWLSDRIARGEHLK